MNWILCLAIPLIFTLALNGILLAKESVTREVTLRHSNEVLQIDPATLGIRSTLQDGTPVELTSKDQSSEVSDLVYSQNQVQWRLRKRGLTIQMTLTEKGLQIEIQSDREQILDWPKTGKDPRAFALAYPESEGLWIPLRDPFWLKYTTQTVCRNLSGGLSMPFWGVHFKDSAFVFILSEDLRSELCLQAERGQINAKLSHAFLMRDGLPALKIILSRIPQPLSPISSALAYRNFLIQEGQQVPLLTKISPSLEAQKLLGAIHLYLWGTGRTLATLEDLSRLGVDRALIVYDADPRTDLFPMTQDLIRKAVAKGFVVAPYDTYGMVQSPKSSNAISAIFDDALFKAGGILLPDGKRMKGFAGLGYQLSSEALKNSPTPFLKRRVKAFQALGVNGYFVDSDACGDFYDDFDPTHPMTVAKDRSNRIQRLKEIWKDHQLVLGSECGAAWSVPFLIYAHGMETLATDNWWKFYRNKKNFGGWWPTERPAHFFKEINAPVDLIRSGYDPSFRIPLYQAVFHDSIIVTDRWECSLLKFKNLFATRSLLTLLYNVPPLFNVDNKLLQDHGGKLKKHFEFFSPLHKKAALKPLTQFEWVTSNKLVQRTQFGNELELIANFGHALFLNIPPRCIKANLMLEHQTHIYCPSH